MEAKSTDGVLKTMLATNLAKNTPAVPVPDWSTPPSAQPSVSLPSVHIQEL